MNNKSKEELEQKYNEEVKKNKVLTEQLNKEKNNVSILEQSIPSNKQCECCKVYTNNNDYCQATRFCMNLKFCNSCLNFKTSCLVCASTYVKEYKTNYTMNLVGY